MKNAHTLKQATRKEQGWRVSRTVSVRATKRKLGLWLCKIFGSSVKFVQIYNDLTSATRENCIYLERSTSLFTRLLVLFTIARRFKSGQSTTRWSSFFFKCLYGGIFTLTTQLTKVNFVFHHPPTPPLPRPSNTITTDSAWLPFETININPPGFYLTSKFQC